MEGTKLGPYRIVEQLGAGGMGEVYRARDERLGRDVAVKVLPATVAEDPERLARFEREARALAALSHPNILSIFDFGKEAGLTYAVTELLEGETLRQRLTRERLAWRESVRERLQVFGEERLAPYSSTTSASRCRSSWKYWSCASAGVSVGTK